MAYFPNGTSADLYREQWCDRCVHQDDPCMVWFAHMDRNYKDCNDEKSILHILIPRSADGLDNERCKMFREKGVALNLSNPLEYLLATAKDDSPSGVPNAAQ